MTGVYTNANWGAGNIFDPTAGVSGTINGQGAALKVAGASVTKNAAGLVLTFRDMPGGLEQASFVLENSGTGATITAAVETTGLTASSITGVTDGNVTLAKGQSSGEFTLTYNPADGAFTNQTLKIVSDFANVAPITITLAPASSLQVTGVSTKSGVEVTAGSTVAVAIAMSSSLVVDTAGGSPTLELNDGAVAQYDAANSKLSAGTLAFDHVVGSGDATADLQVVSVDLNGATVQDGSGNAADFTGAMNTSMNLQIGPTYVASVVASQTTPPAPNTSVHLTLGMSEAVTVNTAGGAPSLLLNDGATATYDLAASDPSAGSLVFDYLVGGKDVSANLAITGVSLNGATVQDAHGVNVDFSGALEQPTGLQIGASPLDVVGIAASQTGALDAGSITLTLTMSEAAAVDTTNGTPSLILNDGGTATYDASLSNPSAGSLVFDYAVLPGDYAANLAVTAVSLDGATIQDAAGYNADLSGALNVGLGVSVGATGIAFASYKASSTDPQTGTVLPITLNMTGGVTVSGSPQLVLNDGAIAAYDTAASSPASGLLVFDYTVGATDYSTDLRISSVNLNGATMQDQAGHPVDLSGAVADLGLDINAAVVNAVSVLPSSGIIAAGTTIKATLAMSAGVTVTGTPTLALSDGAFASYDTVASTPSTGALVFDYVVGANDMSPDLAITGVVLNGGTVTDANGHAADLTVGDSLTGLQIGAPLFVTSITASGTGEFDAGQTIALTIAMNEAVTVTGTPSLSLNDGAVAAYDALDSNPATGLLVFDDIVNAGDSTTNLQVTSVNLAPIATVQDSNGFNANFAAALNVATGVIIGPSVVTGVSASQAGGVAAGQTVQLTLAMSAPVTVTGSPSLTLSNGAIASFDAGLSTATSLVFDYTVGASDPVALNVQVSQVNLPTGTTVNETANGLAANFAAALNASTGVQVGSLLTVISVDAGGPGIMQSGDTIDIELTLNEGAIVNTGSVLPSLTLNDGAIATYDTSGSDPVAGDLQFDYVVGNAEQTADLMVTGVNLNGATIVDATGYTADLTGALNVSTGIAVNPTPTVTAVSIPFGNASQPGDVITLAITMNESVTVTGSPLLVLNDGGTATFSGAFSDGEIQFNYTVAAGDKTPNLAIASINLNGGTVQNNAGANADFSNALNAPTGIPVSAPLFISSVAAIPNSGDVDAGQTIQIVVQMSEPVLLDTTDGAPTVVLSQAAGRPDSSNPPPNVTGIYDVAASNLSSGKLVFDYIVGAGDETSNLQVVSLDLNGAALTDADGFSPSSLNIDQSTGVVVGPSFFESVFTTLNFGEKAEINSGQTVQLFLQLSNQITVTGTPTLSLSNGATATYDVAASNPSGDTHGVLGGTPTYTLAFAYIVGSNDDTPTLLIAGVNLPSGTTIVDAQGFAADFSGAVGSNPLLQVGPDTVTSVSDTFGGTATAYAGQQPGIVIEANGINASVSGGTPTLTLSNGGTATYNPSESFLGNDGDNSFVFDYAVGTSDPTTNDLEITAINLNGATIQDSYGTAVDFSGALDVPTGLSIVAPPTIPLSFVSEQIIGGSGQQANAGQVVEIDMWVDVNFSQTISVTGGSPLLILNDGGTATYNASQSKLSGAATGFGSAFMAFDYTVQPGDSTPDLEVESVNLNGATVTVVDSSTSTPVGFPATPQQPIGPFSGVPVDMQIGPSPLTAQSLTSSSTLAVAGQTVQLTLQMSEAVTIPTPSPTLILNDGATAIFDAGASNPAGGKLVFDYTVRPADTTLNLEVTAIDPLVDGAGFNADYSAVLNTPTGLQITPLAVSAVSAEPGDPISAGETVHVTLLMNEAVVLNPSGGLPSLTLNDGATATYDATVSKPANGLLTFDYVVGSKDQTFNLAVTAVTLPTGTTLQDANGYTAVLSGALNVPTGLLIGPSPLTVTAVNATPNAGEVDAGQQVTLAVTMSEAVTVDTTHGLPSLSLNDGGTAVYDSATSNPAGDLLNFDYTVGANDQTPDLAITAIHLNGATIQDSAGAPADFSGALNAPTGVQVGQAIVTSVQTFENGTVESGGTVHLATYISQPVTVVGTPTLTLNDGATAVYDPGASSLSAGGVVFDYIVGADDKTPNLAVASVNLAGGTSIVDINGGDVNFAPALNIGTDLVIAASPRTLVWTGAADTDFNNPANWDDTTNALDPAGSAPQSNDTAQFISGGGTIDGVATVGALQFSGSTAWIVPTDGALTVGNAVDVGASSILNQLGGTLDPGTLNIATSGQQGGHGSTTVSVEISNAGTLFASSGTETVGSPLITAPSGKSGILEVATNGDLVLDVTSVDATQSVSFTDGTGILTLGTIGGFGGTIGVVHAGDQIIVQGSSIASDSFNSSTDVLTLFDGTAGAIGTLQLAASVDGSALLANGLGGITAAPCFAAGTRISTERGEVAVEDLREGDRVQMVLGRRAQPIVWIGHRHVDCARHPKPHQVWPVRIAGGAFGPWRPSRDLYLSPDHAVYVGQVLIPVKHLINGSSIAQVQCDSVTYYHVELPTHAVLLAEGLPAESYLDTGDRSHFANGGGQIALYPDFASRMWEAEGCVPLVVTGAALDAARQWVNGQNAGRSLSRLTGRARVARLG